MPNVRSTLVTGAQLARILNLSRSRITQLRHSEGCPYVETAGGDRFDLAEVVPWYMDRRGGYTPPVSIAAAPVDPHTEAMARMRKVVLKAIQEHVEALTTDRGLTRFIEILQALGVDDRTKYLARRTVQLWLGTTLPSGEAFVTMESPTDGLPAQWEGQWRDTVGRVMRGDVRESER